MNNKIEFNILLLHLARCNGNVQRLIHAGYSYVDIINTFEKLENRGYVKFIGDVYHLTEQGDVYLERLNKRLDKKGLYKYMSPELRYKTKKLRIDEIYVPLRYKRE